MRKVRWAAIVAALCVVTLGAVPYTRYLILGLLRKQAFYDGRPTNYWRSKIVKLPTSRSYTWQGPDHPITGSSKRSGVGFQLDAWLRRIGLYRSDDGSLPLRNLDCRAIPVLIDLLNDREVYVRVYAIQTLGALRSEALDSVPALIKLLQDREICAFALSPGDHAAEALLEILDLPLTCATTVGLGTMPAGLGTIGGPLLLMTSPEWPGSPIMGHDDGLNLRPKGAREGSVENLQLRGADE